MAVKSAPRVLNCSGRQLGRSKDSAGGCKWITACTPSAPPPCRDKCEISASESEKEVSHEGREEVAREEPQSVEETSEICHTIGNQGASRARGFPTGSYEDEGCSRGSSTTGEPDPVAMEEQDLPVQKEGGGEERSVGEVKRKRIEEVKAPVKAGESSKDGSSCAAPVTGKIGAA